jgi:Tfp pilus assembly protein PilX
MQMVPTERRMTSMHNPFGLPLLAAAAVLFSPFARAQQVTPVAAERPQEMLAAQIRTQGFPCETALGAIRDRKRSKPDRAVWVLRCSNASYRISRAPDMAAKVEPIR